jgi:hypothetical protein
VSRTPWALLALALVVLGSTGVVGVRVRRQRRPGRGRPTSTAVGDEQIEVTGEPWSIDAVLLDIERRAQVAMRATPPVRAVRRDAPTRHVARESRVRTLA